MTAAHQVRIIVDEGVPTSYFSETVHVRTNPLSDADTTALSEADAVVVSDLDAIDPDGIPVPTFGFETGPHPALLDSTADPAVLDGLVRGVAVRSPPSETTGVESGCDSALFRDAPDAAAAYEFEDGEPIIRRTNKVFDATFEFDEGDRLERVLCPGDTSTERRCTRLLEELRSEATEDEEPEVPEEPTEFELSLRTVDDCREFVLYAIPTDRDGPGGSPTVDGYLLSRDVTDSRRREAELRNQKDQLDEFAGIVSHDLRNPLSVASGYLELGRETGDPEHFERVETALDRMDELVSDLLSLARKGDIVGEPEEMRLEALARKAWENVATGGAELVVESDRRIEADPERVQELFENLFRNSVEHGTVDAETTGTPSATEPANGTGPVIRVGAVNYRGNDERGFYVEDDGTGIPAEHREKIFETGFSTDESGTGLGLAITHHIATAHGWETRAATGRDGGARFEFKTE